MFCDKLSDQSLIKVKPTSFFFYSTRQRNFRLKLFLCGLTQESSWSLQKRLFVVDYGYSQVIVWFKVWLLYSVSCSYYLSVSLLIAKPFFKFIWEFFYWKYSMPFHLQKHQKHLYKCFLESSLFHEASLKKLLLSRLFPIHLK